MEEKKEKKKLNKKPLLICLAIALVFAIIGIVDINVNAAEGETYTANITEGVWQFDKQSFKYNDGGSYTIYSDSPMYAFWYRPHDSVSYGSVDAYWYIISKKPIYGYEDASVTVAVNGEIWYLIGRTPHYPSDAYMLIYTSDELPGKRLSNRDYFGDVRGMIADYMSGNLDVIIDYDTLPIDNNIPVITNFKANRIRNWNSYNSKNEYYDYITWENTGNYAIQVRKIFSVYFMRKVDGDIRILGTEHNSETDESMILDVGSISFIQQTDEDYILNERYSDYEWYAYIAQNTDIQNWTKSNYGFQYAIRYVDLDNERAGRWSLIAPFGNIGEFEQTFTFSYQLEDGTMSENIILNGINEEFTDAEELGGMDFVKDVVDAENDYKDRFNEEFNDKLQNADMKVEEVSGWLYSVVGFIKGTPQVVGSVLGFLPQPILYGMYVTIFLGVIASGLAIIKALF